ncbi:MAG TPA: CHASE domain-containing protein [Syntrophales bacterium]|nr:CHASE domain-containing protein [Syntrophales bacterium]
MIEVLKKKKWHVLLIAVISIGIATSLISFAIIQRLDYQRMQEYFERTAEERYSALEREIESNLQVLESIKAHYAATGKVRRSDFQNLVKPLLLNHSSIQALEWIPRIADSQRNMYEETAKRDGFHNFQISDRRAQGVMVKSPRRSEYFPVYFVEPYKTNEIALGYDLASNPARKEALDRSRDTGKKVATRRIVLVQEKAGQYGFLVFEPVYRKYLPSNTIQERRRNLQGFILGVFRISDILRSNITKPHNIA